MLRKADTDSQDTEALISDLSDDQETYTQGFKSNTAEFLDILGKIRFDDIVEGDQYTNVMMFLLYFSPDVAIFKEGLNYLISKDGDKLVDRIATSRASYNKFDLLESPSQLDEYESILRTTLATAFPDAFYNRAAQLLNEAYKVLLRPFYNHREALLSSILEGLLGAGYSDKRLAHLIYLYCTKIPPKQLAFLTPFFKKLGLLLDSTESYKLASVVVAYYKAHDPDSTSYAALKAETILEDYVTNSKANHKAQLPGSLAFHEESKYLTELKRYVPIEPRDLGKEHPVLYGKLKGLLTFVHGKTITAQGVLDYEDTLGKQNYPLQSGLYDSRTQRSVKSLFPYQYVIHIKFPQNTLSGLTEQQLDLIGRVNAYSASNGHPVQDDQLGWARLELEADKSYLLVDEIQSDFFSVLDKVKKDPSKALHYLKLPNDTDVTDLEAQLSDLVYKMRSFPDVAIEAITKFAKTQGYKHIYYHTLEGGKRLKSNNPPKSLYTSVPKSHFFKPTEHKPFDLTEDFYRREARRLIHAANYLLVLDFTG